MQISKFYSQILSTERPLTDINVIASFCALNLRIKFRILHSHKDHQVLFVGGPNTRKTNPRWRTVRPIFAKFGTVTHIGPPSRIGSWNFQHLKIQDGGRPPSWKIEKSPCLSRGLSNFDKIWQADAVRPSWASQPLKMWNFKNSTWWKIGNRPYLRNGLTDLREIWKFGAMTHIGPPNETGSWNLRLSKIQDGGQLSFWKLKIGNKTIYINAKACSCQKCHTPSRQK